MYGLALVMAGSFVVAYFDDSKPVRGLGVLFVIFGTYLLTAV